MRTGIGNFLDRQACSSEQVLENAKACRAFMVIFVRFGLRLVRSRTLAVPPAKGWGSSIHRDKIPVGTTIRVRGPIWQIFVRTGLRCYRVFTGFLKNSPLLPPSGVYTIVRCHPFSSGFSGCTRISRLILDVFSRGKSSFI